MTLKRYRKKLKDLFDTEQQAVTCYLSLERRYIDLYKRFKKQEEQLDQLSSQWFDFDLG